MANDTNQNPWILDTTGVISTDEMRIRKMRWIGIGATGDDLVVQHADGSYLWTIKALAGSTDGDINEDCPAKHFRAFGLKLTTLDSGRLEVWYE